MTTQVYIEDESVDGKKEVDSKGFKVGIGSYSLIVGVYKE